MGPGTRWAQRRELRARRRRRVVGSGPWRRFRVGLIGLVLVLASGTIGYTVIGLDPFDALYQTAITVTTVGYGEIGAEHVKTTSYRAFTLVLVLVGAGTVVYTFSVLFEALVEGSLNDGFRRRRMTRHIDHLQGHLIVVGWGRVGRSIARYATRHHTDVVIVDREDLDTDGIDLVVGDALDDDTLFDAGIERASALVAALDTDGANLALTLTARSLRPDLLIVTRIERDTNERKFKQAGADRVVNPQELGGSRMGALALHPATAEFLEDVLHADGRDTSVVELHVPDRSPALGRTLADLSPDGPRALVLAVRSQTGTFTANPAATYALSAGDTLVVMGTGDQVQALHRAIDRTTVLFRGRSAEL